VEQGPVQQISEAPREDDARTLPAASLDPDQVQAERPRARQFEEAQRVAAAEFLVVRTTRPTKPAEIDGEFHLHRYDQAGDPDALLAGAADRWLRGVATTGGEGRTHSMVDRMPALEIPATSAVGCGRIDIDATEHGVAPTSALAAGAPVSACFDLFPAGPGRSRAQTAFPAGGTGESRDAVAAPAACNLRAHLPGQPVLPPFHVPSRAAAGA
jgi:hypothetical protein